MSYRYPGVFLQEEHMAGIPTQGASTNETGFIGFLPRGPVGEPIRVTNWTQIEDTFGRDLENGPFMEGSYLPYSLYGYYDNGGFIAHVYRIVGDDAEEATATLDVSTDGDLANENEEFDLMVELDGEIVEDFEDISLEDDEDNYIDKVFEDSNHISAVHDDTNEEVEFEANSVGEWGNGLKLIIPEDFVEGEDPEEIEFDGGDDDIDNVSDSDFEEAINEFDKVRSLDYLACPENQSDIVTNSLLSFADSQADMVAIVDVPEDKNDDVEEAVEFRENNPFTRYGAMYYPWIEVSDPVEEGGTPTKEVPVSGHVLGAIARTHERRSVYVAPAGTDTSVFGALSLTDDINVGELEMLTPNNINAIQARRGAGIIIWGARTLASEEKYRYLNHRTGLNYLKKTLKQNSDWVVFEPNNPDLWSDITAQFTSFLRTEIDKEGWASNDPSEAFFVQCDETLNTQEYQEQGIVRARVGVNIAYPAEFFEITIGQWDGGSEAIEQ